MALEGTTETTTPATPVTIEAELAAAFAETAQAVAVEVATADPAAETAIVDTVAPKAEEKPPEPTLARRLAMVAAAEKRDKAAAEARAKADAEAKARDDEMRPALERLAKAKTAASKMEAARIALGLDDEGMAELFLDLHRHHEGREAQPKDPTADLDKLVATRLEAALKARDDADKAAKDKQLADGRAWQFGRVGDYLKDHGDDFPLVAIAPPSEVDITSISEAWITANGEIPEPEAVLKLIQDERQTGYDERQKAAEAKRKPALTTTAPAKAGETSGAKPKPPVATNDAPVSQPRKLSLVEELTAAMKSANVSAA